MDRCYIAIDLKSFYASVECVERGLDPLTSNLVVADETRTDKTICLAVSPSLKQALGIPGRIRLYKVKDLARRKGVEFIIAPPQMRKYMQVSQHIFALYVTFVAMEDIHVYSIDEVFIDATKYLKLYDVTAEELARRMILKVLESTGVTATAGIGTNLYLAKIAMDIKAKHMQADENGVRVAALNEKTYREEMWNHQPMQDFWRFGPGTVRRLESLGIHTMGELARYSLIGSEKLYKTFGVNAELIIDHAWGHEPVTMVDIKNYESENHSLCSGQVLGVPYNYEKTKLILWEMADNLALNMFSKGLVTDQLVLDVLYDNGEKIHGTTHLNKFTCSAVAFSDKLLELFEKLCFPDFKSKRLMISALHIKQRENDEKSHLKFFQTDLFTDYDDLREKEEKEGRLQDATLAIKRRYGRNAILKLKNFEEGATMRERNEQVGGHKA